MTRPTPCASSVNWGNPYAAVGVDPKGVAAIDWGVYGIPETFLVAPDGTIVYKHIGPFLPGDVEQRLIPAMEKAQERR